jgi:hypothetical protein
MADNPYQSPRETARTPRDVTQARRVRRIGIVLLVFAIPISVLGVSILAPRSVRADYRETDLIARRRQRLGAPIICFGGILGAGAVALMLWSCVAAGDRADKGADKADRTRKRGGSPIRETGKGESPIINRTEK